MKYLMILPLLFVGTLHAQSSLKTLQQFEYTSLDFELDKPSHPAFQSVNLKLPKQPEMNKNLQSDIKMVSLNQINGGNFPMNGFSQPDLIMGSTLSNTLNLGSRNLQTQYFFDVSGNLESTQTSFSFKKKKK